MTKQDIYRKALETWGVEAQVCMVFEEMSELQKALCKLLRGKPSFENIIEEIADVEIMLEQMKLLFNGIEEDVKKRKCQKLQRLKKMLQMEDK